MPRTALTPTSLVPNSSIAQPAATTIDATLVTNGVEVAVGSTETLWVEVTQTHAAAKVITVQPGANPPALDAGQGALTRSMVQNAVALFGPFSSGRFVQAGSTLHIDFEASTTGSMRVYRMPRTA